MLGDFQENGGVVGSRERNAPSFGVQILKYGNMKKRRWKEVGPTDTARIRTET